MKKKLLSLALALVMCLALLPTAALADESHIYLNYATDFTCAFKDGVLTISGSGSMPSQAPMLRPFWHSKKVEKLVISPGITTVSGDVRYYPNLTEVVLPAGLVKIESGAFSDCPSLTRVELPDGLLLIEPGTFQNCTSLEEVTIPSSVEFIGNGAFMDCSSLRKVNVSPETCLCGTFGFTPVYETDIKEKAVVYWSGEHFSGWKGRPYYYMDGKESILLDEDTANKDGDFLRTDSGAVVGYCGPGGDVVVPEGPRYVSLNFNKAEYDKAITSVTLPDSVDYFEFLCDDGVKSLSTGGLRVFEGHHLTEARLLDGGLEELILGDNILWVSDLSIRRKISEQSTHYMISGCFLKRIVFPVNPAVTLRLMSRSAMYELLKYCYNLEELVNCPNEEFWQEWQEVYETNEQLRTRWTNAGTAGCIQPQSERIKALSDEICAGQTTDRDKAKAVFDWMTANIKYDNAKVIYDTTIGGFTASKETAITPEAVLDAGETVCEGYANLTQALLQAQNIPTICVVGEAKPNTGFGWQGHAWNLAFWEGDWHYIDSTWGTSTSTQGQYCDEGWFDPTPLRVALDHRAELTRPAAPAAPDTPTATPSTQTVNVDGKDVTFEMYALGGGSTNYIRVRDLAAILNGTEAQFEVGWNGNVALTSGKGYTGATDKAPFNWTMHYTNYTVPTYVDGKAAQLEAIQIEYMGGGFTYYKLRDLGQALGFNVGWSADKGIYIETDKPYDPNN